MKFVAHFAHSIWLWISSKGREIFRPQPGQVTIGMMLIPQGNARPVPTPASTFTGRLHVASLAGLGDPWRAATTKTHGRTTGPAGAATARETTNRLRHSVALLLQELFRQALQNLTADNKFLSTVLPPPFVGAPD
jgi:hypothetical protein